MKRYDQARRSCIVCDEEDQTMRRIIRCSACRAGVHTHMHGYTACSKPTYSWDFRAHRPNGELDIEDNTMDVHCMFCVDELEKTHEWWAGLAAGVRDDIQRYMADGMWARDSAYRDDFKERYKHSFEDGDTTHLRWICTTGFKMHEEWKAQSAKVVECLQPIGVALSIIHLIASYARVQE